MKKQTPSELLAVVQQQLASLTRTVQQLQQSLQQPEVQPLHSQSNGHHSLPGIENRQASDVLPGRRVGRKRKSIPEPDSNRLPQPKKRRSHSMHAKVHAKQLDERQDQAQVVKNSKSSTSTKIARAMEKCSSARRKTISRDSALDVVNEALALPNTNPDMYATNDLYRMLCLYCQTAEKFLVCHYVKQHPQHEVPMARPSPKMADRLRAQAEKFQLNMGKIEAFCLFCEETKKMVKHHWTQHLINHTGELMFACDTCNMKFKNKNDHKNCTGQVMNVFDQNSSDASLMGYMCKHCNYIQFHLSSIEKHLVNEHHQLIDELNYEKLMLIPDMSPVHSDVSAKFGFAEASQRFKCTVCQTQLLDALAFTAHFTDEHNDIDEYQCFCGVTVRKNDLIPGNQWVAAHLLMHRSDLHQCMICMGVYLRKKDVLEHILCTHQGNVQIKHQHVCRNPNRNIKLSESTIQKLICNICQCQVDGSIAHIFDHFNNEHPSETISITGIGSKKITNLARTLCDTETTYEGGKQMSVRQTNTAT